MHRQSRFFLTFYKIYLKNKLLLNTFFIKIFKHIIITYLYSNFYIFPTADDVILIHIMTYLNDEDKNLRGSFYDNIAGVAGFVGWQASDILVPLLQQGFTDREEFVIAKAIRAVTILIELGHIKKPTVTEIIKEAACYLCHPNLWIRHEICGMISTAARTLSAIDVQCKIMPSIGKYLKKRIIQVEKPDILLDCLQEPVPRAVFDGILK